MHRIFCFFILFLSFTNIIYAQDTLAISEVSVVAQRSSLSGRFSTTKLPSEIIYFYDGVDAGVLLNLLPGTQLKSYGSMGGLSTISSRGAGSSRTAVFWNGFSVSSTTAGSTDLSLFSGVYNAVSFSTNASSSVFGSGTFGGVAQLNSVFSSKYDKLLRISTNFGSFGSKNYKLSGLYKLGNWKSSTSFSYTNSLNNFSFSDKYKLGNPQEIREHNGLKKATFQQVFVLSLAPHSIIKIGVLGYKKEKELPEVAGSFGKSSKLQGDKSIKTFARWNKFSAKNKFSTGVAFFYDFLKYTDKTTPSDSGFSVYSIITSKKIMSDILFTHTFSENFISSVGAQSNFLSAKADAYKITKFENETALFADFNTFFWNTQLTLSNRAEFDNGRDIIPSVSLNIVQKVGKINFSAQIASKYRRPSFNDLYWQPGGNPNLLPEKGFTSQISGNYQPTFTEQSSFSVRETLFFSQINNWIQWTPILGIWQAENVKKVNTSGSETDILFTYKTTYNFYYISVGYYFTKTITKENFFTENSLDIGKQLVYVPVNAAKMNTFCQLRKLGFGTTINFTGARSSDNLSGKLPYYFLEDFFCSYKINYQKIAVETILRAENVWNLSYESVKSYPMPGRAFYFSLRFLLHN